MDTERFLVRPGTKVSLNTWDPSDKLGSSKKEAKEQLKEMQEQLAKLQELLFATKQHALLVVLQGMDTSGKNSTIKRVMSEFDPQGVDVHGFGVPTEEELAHDFLWRIHRVTPKKGMVGIFARSHYEDVLVVRVEDLVPRAVWKQRYDLINAFERSLVAAGTIVLKFYLHISREKQRERLLDRLEDPTEHWKFRASDLKTRDKWDQYQAAYEDALSRCSTDDAPWYVVPADRKWARDLIVSSVLLQRLEALGMQWPPLEPEARNVEIN